MPNRLLSVPGAPGSLDWIEERRMPTDAEWEALSIEQLLALHADLREEIELRGLRQ